MLGAGCWVLEAGSCHSEPACRQAGAAKNLVPVSHGILLNNGDNRRVDSSVVPPSE